MFGITSATLRARFLAGFVFRWRAVALCAGGCFLLSTSAFPQGSLTPPGAPAPTMKTLDQVEARTIVNAVNTPGDATHQFIITTAGSYYLTGNITGVSGKHGITINSDNVTLDLNGFALLGVSNSLSAILVTDAHRNLRIRNGAIKGWSFGINAPGAMNSQFDHLRVSQNVVGVLCGDGNVLSEVSSEANTGSSAALRTGAGCILTTCFAASNNNSDGIATGAACTITVSTAVANVNGFNTASGCNIIGCTASFNTGIGIFPGNTCTIKDCTAVLNGTGIDATGQSDLLITNCSASQNSGTGILGGDRSQIIGCTANLNGTGVNGSGISGGIRVTVKNCSASDNQKNGIVVLGDSVVLENHASHNGQGVAAAGIDSSGGGGSRIEANHVRDNAGKGILASSSDIIARNSAGGNTINFSPSSGVNFATVQTPSTATNPLANIVN